MQDVVDHPGDDAPRLIYADWLDECGPSPRAEFIRVQHALAALPAGGRLHGRQAGVGRRR